MESLNKLKKFFLIFNSQYCMNKNFIENFIIYYIYINTYIF